jgi:hypothetical protein
LQFYDLVRGVLRRRRGVKGQKLRFIEKILLFPRVVREKKFDPPLNSDE